jgi:hypothetical protein
MHTLWALLGVSVALTIYGVERKGAPRSIVETGLGGITFFGLL